MLNSIFQNSANNIRTLGTPDPQTPMPPQFAQGDRLQNEAYSQEAPHEQKLSLLGALLGTALSVADPQHNAGSTFLKSFLGATAQQHQNNLQNYQIERQNKLGLASVLENQGQRQLAESTSNENRALQQQKLRQDQKQFEAEDATRRYGYDKTYAGKEVTANAGLTKSQQQARDKSIAAARKTMNDPRSFAQNRLNAVDQLIALGEPITDEERARVSEPTDYEKSIQAQGALRSANAKFISGARTQLAQAQTALAKTNQADKLAFRAAILAEHQAKAQLYSALAVNAPEEQRRKWAETMINADQEANKVLYDFQNLSRLATQDADQNALSIMKTQTDRIRAANDSRKQITERLSQLNTIENPTEQDKAEIGRKELELSQFTQEVRNRAKDYDEAKKLLKATPQTFSPATGNRTGAVNPFGGGLVPTGKNLDKPVQVQPPKAPGSNAVHKANQPKIDKRAAAARIDQMERNGEISHEGAKRARMKLIGS